MHLVQFMPQLEAVHVGPPSVIEIAQLARGIPDAVEGNRQVARSLRGVQFPVQILANRQRLAKRPVRLVQMAFFQRQIADVIP